MTSIRHNDGVLNAARDCVLAYGVRRTTLTDVARRAGVSRMTLYRRWPDVRSLVADLMTREWVLAVTDLDLSDPVAAVVEGVRRLRGHPLWRKIVEADPELLLPYLLDRRGATHEAVLGVLEAAVGDRRKARAVLLVAQSFLLSAPTMLDPVTLDELDAELATLLEAYLG
ncbi:TetR/AcrR family transcriptional regulator [Nonomuraea aurantiaca]|jgi:AcrR family transcriptional regulator|uniref:TetR/AcrR family transcriptional regulator n=1 Tax=Nonomuraea aurantiaca TaxID=2878562 RepID=UPI001CD98F7A|nr:TetR/AcrR family transcriptional regulator [Nonomuraea aurantiaca]MCA2220263.1 TetR/AcrR family transcriptional regulator; helix-turn-helix transcriptional regulator [Nonomuraea aurantiaca]